MYRIVLRVTALGRLSTARFRIAPCFVYAVIAMLVSPVSALAARASVSQISEANGVSFIHPEGLAVDGSDNLWVSDVYPGGTVDEFAQSGSLEAKSSATPWSGEYIESLAFSTASDRVYVSDSNFDDVWGLESSGAYANVDLKGPWGEGCCFIRVAADNSTGSTNGDLYVSEEHGNPGQGSVYRIDAAGSPVPFSATAPYIEGSKLTGFGPGETFVAPSAVAVDGSGRLYVADKGRRAVYEFAPTGEFLRAFTEAEGPLGEVSAVAIDPTNGHVLIADPTNDVVDEFSSAGSYLDDVEGVGTPKGLAVDSTGRLYVADTGGSVVHVFGAYSPPTHQPVLLYGPASGSSDTSVTLNATVNPKGGGEVTECRFEYGRDASYGQTVPCTPRTFSSSTAVSAELSGLLPNSAYHYRLRVIDLTTGPDGFIGPDRSFATNPILAGPPASTCPNPAHTGLSDGLPDCRAYELVTPPDKGNAEDMFGDSGERSISGGTPDVGYSRDDGNEFLLTTASAFGPSAAAGQNGYVFSRTPSGWQGASLAASITGDQSITPAVVSPDFSHVAMEDKLGTLGNDATLQEAGLEGPPGGPYKTMFAFPFTGGGSTFTGASADFGSVFVESPNHGLAAPAGEQLAASSALYEYSDEHYSLVNVDNAGKALYCGAASPGAALAVGTFAHAVSANGSRVFFLSPDPSDSDCYQETQSGFTGTPPQLYVRSAGRTTEVSEPSGLINPDPHGPQPVTFAGASADGSRVFFVTRGELTPDDEGNHDPELYEYNVETSTLTRISRGTSGRSVGNVGWDVPSEDGSTVYFTATGSLAPGAPELHAASIQPQLQPFNLYRYDTASGATTYIATVSGHDWNPGPAGQGSVLANESLAVNLRANWQTTPNGGYLLFAAVENLTGYDNIDSSGHCDGDISGSAAGAEPRCGEVYRYDAADGSLICLSCNPTGAPPVGNALFDRSVRAREARAISRDGAYAFFDTTEPLSPIDTNGRLDVYEWHDGSLSLISSGQDPSNSYFLGTDSSGSNVFFGTHARLAPEDTDTSGDLYDARIDGGFPAPQASVVCEGDTCQSPSLPPATPAPTSLTFSGAGNLLTQAPFPHAQAPRAKKPVAKKCKKGFVKRHGKCVRTKPKRRKRTAGRRRGGRS